MTNNTGICPKCSQVNSYTATRCIDCGFPLPWAAVASQAERASVPPLLPIPDPTNAQWATVPSLEPRPSPVGCLPLFGAAILCLLGMLLVDNIVSGLSWILYLGSTIWVGFDASNIGVKRGQIRGLGDSSVPVWVFGCLLLWVVVFPAYLLARPTLKEINGK